MAQKPITMEQLKQILQLKNDGIGIREIARRTGISRNSVRKYLLQLDDATVELTNKELADKAYDNEVLQSNTQRRLQLFAHFKYAESELRKQGLHGFCFGMNTCNSIPMVILMAITANSLRSI